MKIFNTLSIVALAVSLVCSCSHSLTINELGYFEQRGFNLLAYSNEYKGMFCDEKTAGIELIQRGERLATGGGVRLMNTPEQWDIYPQLISRTVNREDGTIDLELNYPEYDFTAKIRVAAKGKSAVVSVTLDKAVPEALVGKAGLNLEFFPASYMGKTLLVDDKAEPFPHHPAGDTYMRPSSEKITQFFGQSTFDDRGRGEFIVVEPFASGHTFVFAPEDDDLRIKISSEQVLQLFDGRNLAQNGTFVLRTIFPQGQVGTVAQWCIEPSYDAGWVREPNIGYSQIGYTPAQDKVAVVELDPSDRMRRYADILRIGADGTSTSAGRIALKSWGRYNHRYNYALIDFSEVREPGLYCIKYKGVKTGTFPISEDVYEGKWHTTMDVWLPVQMDHMEVNEAYRTWHGRSNMDDALQAPVNYEQHDGYKMGSVTNTAYKPWEHIPGLTQGGWYDAGDFDIQAGTLLGVTSDLADVWELFHPDRDETYIDQKTQFVDIHRPDGIPDIIQQIAHGALNINAQVENIGFVCSGIVQTNMYQYHHIGDGMTVTDGKIYDPSLKPYEVVGNHSGTRDDRAAFTANFSPAGTMSTVAALAAAARVLKPYDSDLSERSIRNALMLWDKYFEDADPSKVQEGFDRFGSVMGHYDSRTSASVQLWLTTGEQKYRDFFEPKVLAQLEPVEFNSTSGDGGAPASAAASPSATPRKMRLVNISSALLLYPYMDDDFKAKVKKAIPVYLETSAQRAGDNPYGVPITGRGWGGNGNVIAWAYNNYLVWRYFPDMIDPETVLAGLNYVYGCHPYNNLSFITSVGVQTKKVAYGNNRADFTVIPGGIVPGLMLMAPDYMENKDDYPFLWGENECCTGTVPSYVSLSIACEEVAASLNK